MNLPPPEPPPADDPAPSPWIRRFASLIPAGGSVLDLACGSGRHARWLAGQGYAVEAVDRDAEKLAALAGVAGVTTRVADLEGGPWPYYGRGFDGIVVANYLWRPLFPHLFSLIEPGGVLIYETFMVGNELLGKPSSPEYLLRRGELLDLIGKRFSIVAFEEGQVDTPRPAVIQRVCAVRAQAFRLPESPAPAP